MKSIKPTFCNSIVLFVFEMIPAKFGKKIQHTCKRKVCFRQRTGGREGLIGV